MSYSTGGHWPNGAPSKTRDGKIPSPTCRWPDIKDFTRTPQDDGTVCYFIGNVTVRVKEELRDDGLHLAPVAGDRVACGQWAELAQKEAAEYCGLLEKQIQAAVPEQSMNADPEGSEEEE